MGDNEGQEQGNAVQGPWPPRNQQLTDGEPGRTERLEESVAGLWPLRDRIDALERQVAEIVAHLREKGTSAKAYGGAIVIQMAGGGE